MRKIVRKAHLPIVMIVAVALLVATTMAYFLSTVSVADHRVEAGTLRLAIDSTRGHTRDEGGEFEIYTVAEDVNGVSFSRGKLEPWINIGPGPYIAYPFAGGNGADAFHDGNRSFWIALKNTGNLAMKVGVNLGAGHWSMHPEVQAAHPETCSDETLNRYPVLQLRRVHIYAGNACEGHEECENLTENLKTQGWSTPSTTATDIDGAPISQPFFLSRDGSANSDAVGLREKEFVVARFDLNFDNTLSADVPVAVQPCYQGASYTYDLQATAYQLDAPW